MSAVASAQLARPAALPVVQADEPIRWNQRLSKAFDVAREQFAAQSAEEALVAKYLAVEIKHLERRATRIPAVRMGAMLTAIGEALKSWSVDDIRNLNFRGEETPPTYEIIQLNSTTSADFLIDGMRFVRQAAPVQQRATVRVEPAWYGLDLTIYGLRETGTAEKLLGQILSRSREINFLKGEAFSLSGEFLPTTDETWADLFLDQKNAAAIARVVSLINQKGKALDNRGLLLMGPPGTGKTLAARIVRNQAKATFIWVSSRDFHYAGSFGGVSQAFDLARECAPSVIVFEDIDNWLTERTIDLLKTEMDGVSRSTGIVTMLTSNYPELLPAALIDRPGRFHDVLKFDLPNDAARKAMLERWLPTLASGDLTRAVKETAGYSGAHVRELARFALIIAEQDALPLGRALTEALTKLAEQRELITATQSRGSRYKVAPAVARKTGIVHRAYSMLRVKQVDGARRIVTGTATSPTPDRAGDIIEPLGVKYTNPLPFLLYHDAERPVGQAKFHKPSADSVDFEARISTIDRPGVVRDRLDEAWDSLSADPPLITAVSIGFRELEPPTIIKGGGYHYGSVEVLELSLVVIPAQADATIDTIKSLDLAATGRHAPGATGTLPVVRGSKAAPAMNIQEQITSFENTRAAKVAAMTALMATASEKGETLDAAQTEQYDGIAAEVKAVDAHLVRFRDLEKASVAKATPITGIVNPETAAAARGGSPVVTVKSNLPPGTAFARWAMALGHGRGDMYKTLAFAKQFKDSTPEVELMIQHADLLQKASVYPGTIADATWAAPLAQLTNVTAEFIDLLRPATLLGKIPNLRKVPFNVSVPTKTAGGTYGWVGEGAPKPVTNLQLGTTTLGMAKAAGIIVLTEELVRVSTPDAEAIVRADMIAGIAQFLDEQFITPSVAAVTNVSPASITNGTTPVTSAGTSAANALTDLKALVNAFTAANLSLANAVFIMSESNAFALATAQNALSQPMFPGMAQGGGTLFGRPVVTSQSAGTNVVLVDAQGILFADDGAVTLDVSREASVEMNTAPTSPVVAATVLVSLWQQNLVGIRAERFINWKRARLASVKYVSQTYA